MPGAASPRCSILRVIVLMAVLAVISPTIAVAQAPSQPSAARSEFFRTTIGIAVGAMDYYSGSAFAYPLLAVRVDQGILPPLTAGIELTHVAAKLSYPCVPVSTAPCRDLSDPLWYAGFEVQLHPASGLIRPFFGATLGTLMNCSGGRCASFGFGGGVRIVATSSWSFQLDAKLRHDSREDERGAFNGTEAKEFRVGLVYRIR